MGKHSSPASFTTHTIPKQLLFPHLTQKYRLNKKTLKKGQFPVSLIKHCELVLRRRAAIQGKLQV